MFTPYQSRTSPPWVNVLIATILLAGMTIISALFVISVYALLWAAAFTILGP